jgi:fatty-acid desaturase
MTATEPAHPISTFRMLSGPEGDAVSGKVVWAPAKSLWTLGLSGVALVLGPMTFSFDALLLFVMTTAITICAGHSVGMHRLLIHRSFRTPRLIEYLLVYLGTLVGMAGPFGMIAAHDIRDWAQRQVDCHPLYAHQRSFLVDAWWQMHCVVALKHPPRFVIEPRTSEDRFYKFLERTWMAQQLPWAVLFLMVGGWGWVIWGIAVRISVSLTGHWMVGHFAHRSGHQGWAVDGVAVQGYNLPKVGLITFGEAFHANHHAFPESARLGLEAGQIDLGWMLIRLLMALHLAADVRLPHNLVPRHGLRRIGESSRTELAPGCARKCRGCPMGGSSAS